MKTQHLWQRDRRGFTLVELIVVIAILAILAGVAIPVYSGYIKKANQAADEQLLAAVNTAFAAACLENRFNARDVLDGVKLKVSTAGDKHYITGIENVKVPASKLLSGSSGGTGFALLSAGASSDDPVDMTEKVNESFSERYFKGNETRELKYYASADDFVFEDGAFHGKGTASAGGTKTVTYKDSNGVEHTVTVSQADINTVLASNFGDASVMSMNELMGEVDSLTDAVSSIGGNIGTGKQFVLDVLASDGFMTFMLGTMGIDPEDEAAMTQFQLKLFSLIPEGATPQERQAIINKINANALVLYTAVHSMEMDSDTLLTELKDGKTMKDYIVKNEATGEYVSMTDSLANMSIVYGLCTAYAYKNNLDTSTYSTIMNYAGTDGFKAYLEADGAADMEGYLSCMNMVNGNLTNIDVLDVLVNGFSDPALVGMIDSVLGRTSAPAGD